MTWVSRLRHFVSALTARAKTKRMLLAELDSKLERGNADPELRSMVAYFERERLFDRTSRMWVRLLALHVDRLMQYGPDDFYHHIGKNYCLRFTDLERVSPDLLSALSDVEIPAAQLMQRQRNLTRTQSIIYNVVALAMLKHYEHLADPERVRALRRVDPRLVQDGLALPSGVVISQDALQSLIEIAAIESFVCLDGATVLEVGAGYGRIPYALMSTARIRRYVIVDIPPALYVSQYFLSNVFPEKAIFRFRPFADYDEVKEEYEAADIAFLMPDQMELLPAKSVDLVVAINCFQEMVDREITRYFDEFDRLSRYLYLKASENPQNVYSERFLALRDYPFKADWKCLERRACLAPSDYSEVVYEV